MSLGFISFQEIRVKYRVDNNPFAEIQRILKNICPDISLH